MINTSFGRFKVGIFAYVKRVRMIRNDIKSYIFECQIKPKVSNIYRGFSNVYSMIIYYHRIWFNFNIFTSIWWFMKFCVLFNHDLDWLRISHVFYYPKHMCYHLSCCYRNLFFFFFSCLVIYWFLNSCCTLDV